MSKTDLDSYPVLGSYRTYMDELCQGFTGCPVNKTPNEVTYYMHGEKSLGTGSGLYERMGSKLYKWLHGKDIEASTSSKFRTETEAKYFLKAKVILQEISAQLEHREAEKTQLSTGESKQPEESGGLWSWIKWFLSSLCSCCCGKTKRRMLL